MAHRLVRNVEGSLHAPYARKTSFCRKAPERKPPALMDRSGVRAFCLGGARRNASNAIPSPPTGTSRIKAQSGPKIRAADFEEINHLSNTNESHDAARWPAGRRLACFVGRLLSKDRQDRSGWRIQPVDATAVMDL